MYVVEVSQHGASVRIADACLTIAKNGDTLGKVPVAEVSVVMLSTPHALCSVAALASLAEQGTPVVFCDASMRPAGMVLPFRGQHEVGRRLAAQIGASLPKQRRVWRAIVRSKITGQARVLRDVTGTDHHLGLLVKRVRSGDPDNVEGRAARRYWQRLFGTSFRRRRGEGSVNKMLDYGYTVLRAAVTRGLCVAGLHPAIGIHHHHRANAFALADDVMEPFRPAVDRIVSRCVGGGLAEGELTPAVKKMLAACLKEAVPIGGEQRTTEDAIRRTASSLAAVILGEQAEIDLPWTG